MGRGGNWGSGSEAARRGRNYNTRSICDTSVFKEASHEGVLEYEQDNNDCQPRQGDAGCHLSQWRKVFQVKSGSRSVS